MKGDLVLFRENIKYIMTSNRIKLSLYLSVCISFMIVITSGFTTSSFWSSLHQATTNSLFIMMSMFLFFINSLNTLYLFDQNNIYIIRFKNRKEYLKQLVKNVVVSNLIIFLLLIGMLIVGLLIFGKIDFSFVDMKVYNIPNFVYILIYLFRYLLIIQCLGIGIVIIKKIAGNYLTVAYFVGFLLWQLITPIYGDYEFGGRKVIDSVFKIFISPFSYFYTYHYSNFAMEIFCSSVYVSALFIIIAIGFHYCERNMKQVTL